MVQIAYYDSRLSMDVEFTKTFNCLSIPAAIFVTPRGQLHQSNVSKIKHPMSACAHVVFCATWEQHGYGCRQSDDWCKRKVCSISRDRANHRSEWVFLFAERPFSPKVTHVYQQTRSQKQRWVIFEPVKLVL